MSVLSISSAVESSGRRAMMMRPSPRPLTADKPSTTPTLDAPSRWRAMPAPPEIEPGTAYGFGFLRVHCGVDSTGDHRERDCPADLARSQARFDEGQNLLVRAGLRLSLAGHRWLLRPPPPSGELRHSEQPTAQRGVDVPCDRSPKSRGARRCSSRRRRGYRSMPSGRASRPPVFSALFGIAGIGIGFVLVRRLHRIDHRRRFATTFIALSPMLVRYSQQLREYVLVAELVLLSTSAARARARSRLKRNWLLYGLSSHLRRIYTSLTFAAPVLATACAVLALRAAARTTRAGRRVRLRGRRGIPVLCTVDVLMSAPALAQGDAIALCQRTVSRGGVCSEDR